MDRCSHMQDTRIYTHSWLHKSGCHAQMNRCPHMSTHKDAQTHMYITCVFFLFSFTYVDKAGKPKKVCRYYSLKKMQHFCFKKSGAANVQLKTFEVLKEVQFQFRFKYWEESRASKYSGAGKVSWRAAKVLEIKALTLNFKCKSNRNQSKWTEKPQNPLLTCVWKFLKPLI